jgi:integrase
MRVFERKGNKGSTWCIDFTYKGRRTVKAVGPDQKMAKLAAKKIEMQIFEGKFFPESRRCKVRFRDFAEEYMEKHSRRTKRSWPRDEQSLKRLLPCFGDVFLSDITPRMIENYRIKREKDGVKPATINREHALLKNMFTKAINWEIVRDNPAKKVPMGKEEPRIRFLSKEEISHLLDAAESDRAPYLMPILVLALNTGMRKGEILNLRWVDVDFERRAIQVKKTKNDQPREVPMTDWLFDTLWDWKQKRLDTEFVFTHNNRQPIRSLRTAFERALKRAGIEDFRFHDLRHTAASQMYMSGLDIKFIKEIGGWKTLQMVDRYSHISTEHKRASMLIFESHLHPAIDTKPQQIKRALS